MYNPEYRIYMFILLLGLLISAGVIAYPLDGLEHSGIRRLQMAQQVQAGERQGTRLPEGALHSMQQIHPRLLQQQDLQLPAQDSRLNEQLLDLLDDKQDDYSLAVLDLSDPLRPVFAEHRGSVLRNPGSVGKLLVATALFQALADTYPDDIERRLGVLRETMIRADGFIQRDHHKVQIRDPDTGLREYRALQEGDQGSLWEYLDWMLSASSNAAASMVMQQAMLLVEFGRDYPPDEAQKTAFFKQKGRAKLGEIFQQAVIAPIRRNGLDPGQLRQGSFFTRAGNKAVPVTTSHASTHSLMQFLLALEKGAIVDAFSSREIKRLMYMTEKRIRYASSPALRQAAVYFKSGSLYQCKPETDFKCYKYHGNVKNYMNSVAIVEDDSGPQRLFYLVALMSNVLRKNSAVDHQTLATRIHRLLQQRHALKTP